MLARLLVRAGCGQDKIGRIIQLFGRVFGRPVRDRMSAHTVRRAVHEGGVASDIQVAYEVSRAACKYLLTLDMSRRLTGEHIAFTASGDGTTVRHINLEARHIAVPVTETYQTSSSPFSDSSATSDHSMNTPKNRLLGVDSSVDHTSESQVSGWKEKFAHIAALFSASPFAQRTGRSLSAEECARRLAGMGGDHAADQFKTTNLLAKWKKDATYLVLARDHLGDTEAPSPAFQRLLDSASTAAISSVGGEDNWGLLSAEDQVAITAEEVERASSTLGKSLYEALSEDEKRPLDLFLRLGCAMHKDLNSVKGGNTAMMAAWADLGLVPPVLLANKQNASTLREVDLDALADAASLLLNTDLSPAEVRALESSARGGGSRRPV